MFSNALFIAYAVFFLNVIFNWQGQIFDKLGEWLDERLPEYISKPLYGCPICMSIWWGVAFQYVMYLNGVEGYGNAFVPIFLTAMCAGGINVINVVIGKWYEKMTEDDG